MPAGFGFMARLVFGISKPRQPILGTELAGEVESVGKDVEKFKVGDQVFAFSGAGMGCHAEYKCMPEDGEVVPKPANLTYDEAAAISFGGTTAWSFFRRAGLQSGEKVLVNGASGGVGTAAVQLAKHFGAEVTGVCSTANVELVKSLGANRVVDYTKEDFTKNGETYDVIVDTAGTAPFRTAIEPDHRHHVHGATMTDRGKAPSESRVRRAAVTDAESIAAVHVRAWRSAYRTLLPPAVLDQVDAASRSRQWRTHIESGARQVLVAVTEDGIVGFCSLAPSRDAGAPLTCGEITALYVEPSSWRRGHGRDLLAAARDHAAARGWTELTLWVLSSNQPAREFYVSLGFEHDGAEKNQGEPPLAEARYRFRVLGC